MYTVTFYSHKGGVGRTQALVNIALFLAQSGRRVLIVDFDLEAPGIDTLNLPHHPGAEKKGVVDFVTEYLTTGISPEVEDFVYESWMGPGRGKLFVMPAGKIDNEYSCRFNAIDWDELYSKHNGYVLFEDLKQKWKRQFEPDYVFIDSRTGHTDVSGICTRQLADAVVLMFFPNKQNLRGISKVAADIDNEAKPPREKKIDRHIVMSNVPDLDDEYEVFKSFVSQMKEELRFDSEPMVINHYPSWDFMDEKIFIESHPNSRLAKQYRELANVITRQNLEDADGAVSYLNQQQTKLQQTSRDVRADDLDKNLEKISGLHDSNPHVLRLVGETWNSMGEVYDAAVAFDMAESAGDTSPEIWLLQASCRIDLQELDIAEQAIQKLLDSSDATSLQVNRAISLMLRAGSSLIDSVWQCTAIQSLGVDELAWLAARLSESASGLDASLEIFRQLLEKDLDDPLEGFVSNNLALHLIGKQCFDEAMQLISDPRLEKQKTQISEVFNYAMAEWGKTKERPDDLFQEVISLSVNRDNSPTDDVNFVQCLALCYWIVGDVEHANELINRSRQLLLKKPKSTLSCWRFRNVDAGVFLEDLDDMKSQMAEGTCSPQLFMVRETA